MPKKGEKTTPEQRQKISDSMRGNLNALITGEHSKQVQAWAPLECSGECPLWSACPQKVMTPGSICPVNSKLYSLASKVVEETGDQFYYDFRHLAAFLGDLVAVQAMRYGQAVGAERESGLVGDPDVTRLGVATFRQAVSLGRVVGLVTDSPSTVILDQRRQTIQIQMKAEIDALSEEEFTEMLLIPDLAGVSEQEREKHEKRLAELLPGTARLVGE